MSRLEAVPFALLACSISFFISGALGLTQCGTSTTYCPGECCSAQYSPTKYGCILNSGEPVSMPRHYFEDTLPEPRGAAPPPPAPGPSGTCCMPGPKDPPSTTLPNCLVFGDSVSIGYNGVVANNLSSICQVQHGPWDVSDGGAGATSYSVACMDNWLVTQAQQPIKWDVIHFNFGLHNLDNSSAAEELYAEQLTNITNRLVATGAKLQYALTTPFMPDHTVGNYVVEDLNAIASKIMTANNIPIIDLYHLVTNHCGANYTTCDICRVEPCSYHYNSVGETAQGLMVAAGIRERLSGK